MQQKKKTAAPLYIPHGCRPKVLLVGNGLNRVYGGASWASLLAKINRTDFTAADVQFMPFPMQAVLLSNDHVDVSLKDLRRELSRCELHPWLRVQLEKLLAMDFDCILTTNFTYELECAADPDFLKSDAHRRRMMRHTEAVEKAETRFMLHTYYEIPTPSGPRPLFHIHGEAAKVDSVILGHYYYGNLLFRANEYLTQRGRGGYLRAQRGGRGFPVLSWLDYFILGDVYTLGCGLDTSEMDLWWLLCRKKRERANHGEVRFFEPRRAMADTKIALLNAYNVKIFPLGMKLLDTDGYKVFYELAIDEIRRQLQGGD